MTCVHCLTTQSASVSVLMPTRNSSLTLIKALDALVSCDTIKEILIADGGSEDQTLKLISTYDSARVKVMSRGDNGLYDGVNKIIPHVTGQYVLFMNSDDVVNCEYVQAAVCLLADSDYDYVFGDIVYGGLLRQPRFTTPPKPFKPAQLMPFPHVSLMMGAELFKKIGTFDTGYRIAADLDFINRLISITSNGKYLPKIAAVCGPDGLSSGSKQVYESWQIAIRHGRHPIAATLTAAAVYAYRGLFLSARQFIHGRLLQSKP